MRHIRAALFGIALLTMPMAGCNTLSSIGVGGSNHQTVEKAMIDCDSAYSAIAVIVSQIDASGASVATKATADTVRMSAWNALMIARKAYAAGTAPSLATLTAMLTQVQAIQSGVNQ